jgi:pimeloyl-ACP methyl ester carboxylesterase
MTVVCSQPVSHGWTSAGALRLHHLRWEGGPGDEAGESTDGDATPIVCLHGVCGQAWAWNAAAPLLAARGPVLALDMRGHGGSSWAPDGDYSTATMATDIATALDQLGLGPVDLVGLSWGGLVGATLAAARSDLVRRLVMVDVPPVFGQAVDDLPARPGSFETLDEVIAFEAAANAHAPAEHVAVLASGSVRPGAGGLERCHDPYFLGEWPFRAEDHWPAVGGVTCPALLVRAANSFVLSEELAAAEAQALGAELVEIGPSGHLVPVDQPALFAEAVLTFLA